MKRRDFIKTSAIIAPMMGVFPADLSSVSRVALPGKIEKRSLGRTGEMLSMIGFGGIIVMDATPAEASESVKLAINLERPLLLMGDPGCGKTNLASAIA